jgi:translation initiation factor RLI1
MKKKQVLLNFNKCNPKKCSPKHGKCIAVRACKQKVIIQEEEFEAPIIFEKMCSGCGKCVCECPLNAIDINN